MNRRWTIILVGLVLVQNVANCSEMLPRTLGLNPHLKVSLNKSELIFKHKYDVLCIALLLYKYDALKRFSKDVIKELIEQYDGEFFDFSSVHFDLGNMGIGKKGWTRYYPFTINGKDYIIRIFLTEEREHQDEMPILFKGSLEEPAVTFQILPSLSELLDQHKIKPLKPDWIHVDPLVDSSP